FRILSLDGGGSWALIQVRALSEIFEAITGKSRAEITGHEVLKHFDYAAANSGGSITLAGLAANWTLEALHKLFQNTLTRRAIFAPLTFAERLRANAPRLGGIGPKYSSARKFKALSKILGAAGATPLSKLPNAVGKNYAGRPVHFLICAHRYDVERA